jgi:lipoate-protein ligase A
LIGGRILETYNRIGRALVCGLGHLGVKAELHRASLIQGRNPSCFSSTGRYEVVVAGKKLIGSAQRRVGGAILQHGSLLTGPGYRNLIKFLRQETCAAVVEGQMNHVTTLSDVLGDPPSFNRIADALRLGFEETFGCRLLEGNLTEEEQALTRKLAEERYKRRGEYAPLNPSIQGGNLMKPVIPAEVPESPLRGQWIPAYKLRE